jgi:hypothetical protein
MPTRRKTEGIRKLIKRYTIEFQIPENIDHYSPEDYARAEKQFVKHCLKEGCLPEPKQVEWNNR